MLKNSVFCRTETTEFNIVARCIIVNLAAPIELVIIQIDDHVSIRLISQFINGISRILQKLLNCFNDTAISTSFVLHHLLQPNFLF